MIGNKPRQIHKYGEDVWQHPDMDKLRRTECLCMNCEHLGDCDMADEMYHFCKKNNIALAVTRCPEWKKIETTEK